MDFGALERRDQQGKDFIRDYMEYFLPVKVLDLSSGSGEEKYGVDQVVEFLGATLCYIDPEVREGVEWGRGRAFPYKTVRILARKKKFGILGPVVHATISPNLSAMILTGSDNLLDKYLKPVMTVRGEDMGYEVPIHRTYQIETDDSSLLYEWFGRIVSERYRSGSH